MAQAYRETTAWADGNTVINHTYLLDGDKMLAYIRQGTDQEFWFRTPIRISRSGRRFQLVEANPFSGLGGQVARIREIDGSKGAKYIVDLDAKTCTCPGYTYRGACKHVKELDTV
jgi:hypothetical protein